MMKAVNAHAGAVLSATGSLSRCAGAIVGICFSIVAASE